MLTKELIGSVVIDTEHGREECDSIPSNCDRKGAGSLEPLDAITDPRISMNEQIRRIREDGCAFLDPLSKYPWENFCLHPRPHEKKSLFSELQT
ncbi:hypothetical protein L195_g047446, partial [Trifolium pratense]